MSHIFEVTDKSGKKVHLSKERWKHVLKHPHMDNQIDSIQDTLKSPTTIRYFEGDDKIRYFYKEFKERDASERYLLI